jgi:hypothetical protein
MLRSTCGKLLAWMGVILAYPSEARLESWALEMGSEENWSLAAVFMA